MAGSSVPGVTAWLAEVRVERLLPLRHHSAAYAFSLDAPGAQNEMVRPDLKL